MLSAGRVLIKPEGEYSPLKTYEMLDYVSYNGSSYIAKKTTTGNLPTDTEYWQLSASGAQSQNVASNFAEVEGSDIASSPHAINDVFVNKDGKLLKATLAISIGDTIVIDTNCEPTTVEDLISYLSTQVRTLDSSNKKLNGITEIAVQTDLHTLSLGEFYKDKTSFYVTNGPEEIDEVASAIFRLTVESALDGSSTTRLLTLKTPGGKVYTQNYDGSSWGDWEQVAFESEVGLKQNITDNTLQTTSKTVPGAINELLLKSQAISNPNLLDNPWFTVNQRGITSWSNESVGYSADRWKHDGSATGNITNGVYTCNAPTYQIWEDDRITPLLGKTVTLSWILSDGSIGFETKTLPSALTSEYVWPFTNTYVVLALKSGNASQVARITAGVAVKAIKLELGSVSTLAMDTAPNYATELLKCQRYFYRLKSTGGNDWIAFGIAWSSSAVNVIIPIPSMRALPTASVSDMTKLLVAKGSSTLDPHRISQILAGYYKEFGSSIAMTLTLADSTATNGDNYVFKADAPVNIDFSADL